MTNKTMLSYKNSANRSLQNSSIYATRKTLFLNAYQYFIDRGMGNDTPIENLAQQ
ncbi:hypothetical protein [Ascidiimonas sp. W6]|uniref:hypothetical protein n=1 Tax=Ascidiimonas meishanensis TaxID=3128903 RepID=UPI0030EC27AE